MSDLGRAPSLAAVAAAYLLAGATAWLTVELLHAAPLAEALIADVVATVVIWALSELLRNASLYDPYWSVAPPVIAIAWAVGGDGDATRAVLVCGLVAAWGVRLTLNWATGWRGLGHEDWRYRKLRADTRGRLPFWVVNLGGIQLMPTLLVFAGLLAVYPAVTSAAHGFGALDVVALVVTAAAIVTEATADLQLRAFTRDPAHREATADRGLWAVSRHPNYLGQIGFWWGLWLFALAADPAWWWTVGGPLAMVALFVTVSVPMMDVRSLERRPGYAEHMAAVPALIPRLTRRRSTARRSSA
jgi:steroid 5-alpha reductase family enzyme